MQMQGKAACCGYSPNRSPHPPARSLVGAPATAQRALHPLHLAAGLAELILQCGRQRRMSSKIYTRRLGRVGGGAGGSRAGGAAGPATAREAHPLPLLILGAAGAAAAAAGRLPAVLAARGLAAPHGHSRWHDALL